MLLPHMPNGAKLLKLVAAGEEKYPDAESQHYAIEVPTTEGPHVVDFTHRQFSFADPSGNVHFPASSIRFPLVEHKDKFLARPTLQQGFGMGPLVEGTPL